MLIIRTRSGVCNESSRNNTEGTADATTEELSNGLDLGVIEGVLGLNRLCVCKHPSEVE